MNNFIVDYCYYNFYIGNRLVNKECDDLQLFKNASKFYSIKSIMFRRNTRYSKVICPFVFYNSSIKSIVHEQLTNTFMRTNLLAFTKNNQTFNATIQKLTLSDVYNIQIDSKLLNPNTFTKLYCFQINGHILGIEKYLFRGFPNLKRILLRADHIREFL